MAFDATIGGAAANSYVTVEEANDYFALSLHAAEWPQTSAGADLLKKQAALVSATRLLDAEQWVGSKATSAQALRWPRIWTPAGDHFVDDHAGDVDRMPAKLKEATCDVALYLLQNNPQDDFDADLSQFSEVTLPGGLSLKTRSGAQGSRLPAGVVEKLTGLLASGYGTCRLVRA